MLSLKRVLIVFLLAVVHFVHLKAKRFSRQSAASLPIESADTADEGNRVNTRDITYASVPMKRVYWRDFQQNLKVLDNVGKQAKDASAVAVKVLTVLAVSRIMVKVVTKWYVDFTKDELLFDARDHRYRNFGAIFHDAASSTAFASSIMRDKIAHAAERQVLDRMVSVLSMECFTHTLDDFEEDIQEELSTILPLAESLRSVASRSRAYSSSSRHPLTYTTVLFSSTSLVLVRQADAQLRQARNNLLRACTRLEDHLEYLKSKLVYDNAAARFDHILSVKRSSRRLVTFAGRVASWPIHHLTTTRNTTTFPIPSPFSPWTPSSLAAEQHMGHSYNRDRIAALEQWAERMYLQLGTVQAHLDGLEHVEMKCSATCRLSNVPSYVLPWAQKAVALCHGSEACLRNGNSPVDSTVTAAVSPSGLVSSQALLVSKTSVRRASCRQLHRAMIDQSHAAASSSSAVRRMPESFRQRLDIETRVGDVLTMRYRTRSRLAATLRFVQRQSALVGRLCFGVAVGIGVIRARQHSDFIKHQVVSARENTGVFLDRRIVTPSLNILNDVVFNKKVAITDREALLDSQRSLGVMIDDYLKETNSGLSEDERHERVARLDMTDISKNYERELKKPIQNILSGRIARLALIQMQFMKKELLVAMEAIDDLVNANQVNLQILAIGPAIMAAFFVSRGLRSMVTVARSFNRGSSRLVQTKQMVRRDLKNGFRALERELCLTDDTTSVRQSGSEGATDDGKVVSRGRVMCILYRMHATIMDKSELLSDETRVKQLLQDLADLMTPNLDPGRQLSLLKLCQENL